MHGIVSRQVLICRVDEYLLCTYLEGVIVCVGFLIRLHLAFPNISSYNISLQATITLPQPTHEHIICNITKRCNLGLV